MLTFDSANILAIPGVRFSDGNMQGLANVFNDDAGFKQLDFDDIYHEGPMTQTEKDRIRRARCAEVLIPSPLQLAPYLRAVICRSSAERKLLLHEMGETFPAKDRIRVFNEAGVFNADFPYVETVDLGGDGVHVKFHAPRRGSSTGEVRVCVTNQRAPQRKLIWEKDALEFWRKWTFKSAIPAGTYLVEVWIRNCLAYRALSVLTDDPF